MAESQQERLRKEISCPLCLDIFKDPKRLPCDHVYCGQCLHGLISRSTGVTFSCPECQSGTPVPSNFDVSTFSTPHQVNRLVEIYVTNMESAHTVSVSLSTPQSDTCRVHTSQPLELYCETCKRLVCRDCVLRSCFKKNHKHGFIDELAEKYHSVLEQELKPIRQHHQLLTSALDEITATERESQSEKEAKLFKINSSFDNLHEILEQERNSLTKAVQDVYQKEEDGITYKRREITEVLSSLKSTIESVETSHNEPKAMFLADVENKKQEIKNVNDKAVRISSHAHPEKRHEPEIEIVSEAELRDLCQSKSFLYQRSDPLKGHIDHYDISTISMCKPTDISLYISPPQMKSIYKKKVKIDCQLHRSYDNHSQIVNVQQITPDKYSLTIVPEKRGKHELHLVYNDTHICGSPIPVYVTLKPQEIARFKVLNIKNAVGVKYHNGNLYVFQKDEGMKILRARSLETIRNMCRITISGMYGADIDANFIYLSCTTEDRVVKVDLNTLKVVNSVGTQGSDPGHFDYPNGIRLSKDNELYVCDSSNHRVQVFDQSLQLLRTIGGQGSGNRHFYSPDDLDFDDDGNIYVVEQLNHRIQVLTPQGKYIRTIGRYGNGPGELSKPISPAIHRGMLYVTDKNNKRISVFKTTGEFVTTFGEGVLSSPESIAIDENGYIYVTNARSQLIRY